MGTTAVINATALSSYAFEPLSGGAPAFGRVLEFAAGLPELGRIVVLTGTSFPATALPHEVEQSGRRFAVERVEREHWDVKTLVEQLVSLAPGDEDAVFYLFGDQPLYDPELAAKMFANHRRYFAEYTFADGYPAGLSPEILGSTLVRALPRLVQPQDREIARDTLFALVQRDINAFDIETEIAPKDQRLLRVQLYCDTRRNHRLVGRLLERAIRDEDGDEGAAGQPAGGRAGGAGQPAGGGSGSSRAAVRVSAERVQQLVERHGALLRTEPAFVEVQITEGLTQPVSYSPYLRLVPDALTRRGEMPVERFRRVLEQVKSFSDDAVVNLSLWGEPALHSELPALLAELHRFEGLSALVETSGVGWKPGMLDEIARSSGNRITWIVDLDASTRELYRSLRGDGWEEANALCERLLAMFPGMVYVQAVRMTTNEADLEQFYRTWKDRVPNVVIQKYDHFCGFLPQLKVTDISPLTRLPCWHLKRDLVVLIDGRVPMCREDVRCEQPLGNLFDEELSAIWERGRPLHLRHVAGDYPELCKACDEYYTYNF